MTLISKECIYILNNIINKFIYKNYFLWDSNIYIYIYIQIWNIFIIKNAIHKFKITKKIELFI